MPFEPDWSKIFRHHSVTDQFKEFYRQIAPYLLKPVTVLDLKSPGKEILEGNIEDLDLLKRSDPQPSVEPPEEED